MDRLAVSVTAVWSLCSYRLLKQMTMTMGSKGQKTGSGPQLWGTIMGSPIHSFLSRSKWEQQEQLNPARWVIKQGFSSAEANGTYRAETSAEDVIGHPLPVWYSRTRSDSDKARSSVTPESDRSAGWLDHSIKLRNWGILVTEGAFESPDSPLNQLETQTWIMNFKVIQKHHSVLVGGNDGCKTVAAFVREHEDHWNSWQ